MTNGGRRALIGSLDRLFRHGTAAGLSDGQLLDRFLTRHGEAAEVAFAALVERHGATVWRACSRSLYDPNDAQDAFQATFLVLMKKAGSVKRSDSLGPWLHGVARRVSARAKAEAARRRVVEGEAGTARPIAYVANPAEDALWEEVDRLPESLRAAVVSCYLQGLTHEQAATRLGWPVGTVRSRLARARDRLRGRLERRGLAPEGLAGLVPLPPTFSWPIQLVDTTARAALTMAARDAATAGLVSTAAASLTEGVLRTMMIGTMKTAAAVVVATGALLTGAGAFAFQSPDREPAAVRPRERAERERPRESDQRQAIDDRNERVAPPATVIFELVERVREYEAVGRTEEALQALAEIREVTENWSSHLKETRPNGEPFVARPDVPVRARSIAPDRLIARFPVRNAPRAESRELASERPSPRIAKQDMDRDGDPQSARDQRLDALERKLDRVIEALEGRRPQAVLEAIPAVPRSADAPSRATPSEPARIRPARPVREQEATNPRPARPVRELESTNPVAPIEPAVPPVPPVPPEPPAPPTAPLAPKEPDLGIYIAPDVKSLATSDVVIEIPKPNYLSR